MDHFFNVTKTLRNGHKNNKHFIFITLSPDYFCFHFYTKKQIFYFEILT